jgi:hypothetical protein
MDPDVPCEFSLNAAEVQAILASSRRRDDDFSKYAPLWGGVFGWLDHGQGRWLFDAALETSPAGEVVEIGSAFGRSTICLGLGARYSKNGRVWAVDPHTGDIEVRRRMDGLEIKYSSQDGFDRNISRFGLQGTVVKIVKTSKQAALEWEVGLGIRLAFIDGWHTYDAVKEDLLLWYPSVVHDGIMAIHDYSKDDVKKAITDAMLELGEDKVEEIDANMAFMRKTN